MKDVFKSAIEYSLGTELSAELKPIFAEVVRQIIREHETEFRVLIHQAVVEALKLETLEQK